MPMHEAWRVLVVCKGNVCRSPLAEAVLKQFGEGHVDVRSRGTRAWHAGKPADPAAVGVGHERGFDLKRHIATEISQIDVEWADEVLAVDRETLAALRSSMPNESHRKLRLFTPDGTDIRDPYRCSEDVFREVLALIEDAGRAYAASLRQRAAGP